MRASRRILQQNNCVPALSLQVAFLQRLVSEKKIGFTLSLNVQTEDLGNPQPKSLCTPNR